MSYPYPNDNSHTICLPLNLASRSVAHKPERRERIDFSDEKFSEWCDVWGDRIVFKQVEYRKETNGVEHEFIFLRELSLKEGCGPLPPSYNPPENKFWAPERDSNMTFTQQLKALICKLERTAHPHAQVNALDSTDAFDYIDFKPKYDLTKEELKSTIELKVSFEDPVPLKNVLAICRAIALHPQSCHYTLQQFNCFFFSWSIIILLLRPGADRGEKLLTNQDRLQVTQGVASRIAELGNPQTIWSKSSGRVNIALLIAGDFRSKGSTSAVKRSLVSTLEQQLRESPFLKASAPESQQLLWSKAQIKKIRTPIREVLEMVADATNDVAVAGTGQSAVASLFWADTHLDLERQWEESVQKQYIKLLDRYVRSMWEPFAEALTQTCQDEKRRQQNRRESSNSNLTVGQQLMNSQLVLGARLTGLGTRTALNGARAAASVDNISSYNHLPKPILKVRHAAKTVQHTPSQLANVARIAAPWLSVLAMRREEHQVNGTSDLTTIRGLGTNMFRLMGDIDLKPEKEDQVLCELEESVKLMAEEHKACDIEELRTATLELLIRLKEQGRKMNLGMNPDQMWRLCLWYSLGEKVIDAFDKTLEESEPKFECWIKASIQDYS